MKTSGTGSRVRCRRATRGAQISGKDAKRREFLLADLRYREATFAAALERVREVTPAVNLHLRLASLPMLEELSARAAEAYRQLATASWELARAQRELGK